jgi:hypothetical protein
MIIVHFHFHFFLGSKWDRKIDVGDGVSQTTWVVSIVY